MPGSGRIAPHSENENFMTIVTRLDQWRSEEHTSELQSLTNIVCRLLLEKKKSSVWIWLAVALSGCDIVWTVLLGQGIHREKGAVPIARQPLLYLYLNLDNTFCVDGRNR